MNRKILSVLPFMPGFPLGDYLYEEPKRVFIRKSKYTPHQGKKECARRLRQMERLACK